MNREAISAAVVPEIRIGKEKAADHLLTDGALFIVDTLATWGSFEPDDTLAGPGSLYWYGTLRLRGSPNNSLTPDQPPQGDPEAPA
jgi:hypothetical protein